MFLIYLVQICAQCSLFWHGCIPLALLMPLGKSYTAAGLAKTSKYWGKYMKYIIVLMATDNVGESQRNSCVTLMPFFV